MRIQDWISAFGIITAIVLAGISYGIQSAELRDAREEIGLLRQDVRAINQYLVDYSRRLPPRE